MLVGPAAETLQTLPSDEKFDFAFIDADKASNLTYFLQAKRLVRRGGIIVRTLLLPFLSPAQRTKADRAGDVCRSSTT